MLSGESRFQSSLNKGPLFVRNAEHDRVSNKSIRLNTVISERAFIDCSEFSNRLPAMLIPFIGFKLHANCTQRFESMLEQKQLDFWIDLGSPMRPIDPSHTNLQASVLGADVHVARRPNSIAGGSESHTEPKEIRLLEFGLNVFREIWRRQRLRTEGHEILEILHLGRQPQFFRMLD